MLIKRFQLSEGHGYLNLDLSFFPDLTFLTGINGSGKTTVVRGLVALLTPSLSSLANTMFSTMSVTVNFDNAEFTISSEKLQDKEFRLTVSSIEQDLVVPIFKKVDFEREPHFLERESEFYREFHTSNSKHPILEFLAKIPTPMFLDLERRAQGPITRRRYVSYEHRQQLGFRYMADSGGPGLSDALELADEEFRRLQSNQSHLTDRLRTGLILTAFAPLPEQSEIGAVGAVDAREENLRAQEAIVLSSLNEVGIPRQSIDETVKRFFAEIWDLFHRVTEIGGPENLFKPDNVALLTQWLSAQPQIRQIDRIVRLVERYNENLTKTRKPIQRYLDSLNRFLQDGGKRFDFTKRGRLRIFVQDKELSGLSGLSSGERQLFVILTHLAFNEHAHAANILIIDEPEISLHVRWQEMFVQAMQEAREGLQLILATHSPSIILDRIDNCVDVSGS